MTAPPAVPPPGQYRTAHGVIVDRHVVAGVHEAGHVVATWRWCYGSVITSATALSTPEHAGRVDGAHLPMDAESEQSPTVRASRAVGRIRGVLAGLAAEEIYLGLPCLTPPPGVDPREWLVSDTYPDVRDAVSIATKWAESDPSVMGNAWPRIRAEYDIVLAFLRAAWPAVSTVARALVELHTLDRERLAALRGRVDLLEDDPRWDTPLRRAILGAVPEAAAPRPALPQTPDRQG